MNNDQKKALNEAIAASLIATTSEQRLIFANLATNIWQTVLDQKVNNANEAENES